LSKRRALEGRVELVADPVVVLVLADVVQNTRFAGLVELPAPAERV
jgi:hypothetical protein